nr:MAG TPA: hypothetical protein [Caudoviricetes sp.]
MVAPPVQKSQRGCWRPVCGVRKSTEKSVKGVLLWGEKQKLL